MRKTTSIILDEETHSQVKILAAKLGVRPNTLIEQAIKELLEKDFHQAIQRLAEEEK